MCPHPVALAVQWVLVDQELNYLHLKGLVVLWVLVVLDFLVVRYRQGPEFLVVQLDLVVLSYQLDPVVPVAPVVL